ncbi:MAG: c-type cytochrome [Roseibium sp.]|uniref:c-type cytochrome n=1 Tax=Roseibium sp. TaxID=1936156 RepID=UPI003D9C4C1D
MSSIPKVFLLGSLCLSPTQIAAETADGAAVFGTRCATCHTLEPGVNRAGPSLAGLIGRPAGTMEGARYSRAMQDTNIVWDERSANVFLANPRSLVEGTTMNTRLRSPEERNALIEFLTSGS